MLVATTVKDTTRMALIFFIVAIVPGMFAFTGLRKAFRAKRILDNLALRMNRVLRNLRADIGLNESTNAIYAAIDRGFTEMASWIKYWQVKEDKHRANALKTEFDALFTEAIALFGRFEEKKGSRVFYGPASNTVLVTTKALDPIKYLNFPELRPISNNKMMVHDFASALVSVKGVTDSPMLLLRLVRDLLSEADLKSPLGVIIGNEILELIPRENFDTKQAIVTQVMS